MEYDRYPRLAPDDGREENPIPTRGDLLTILAGKHPAHNPRSVPFFDPPLAQDRKSGLLNDDNGQPYLVDSFGNPFVVVWDADGDGALLNPAHGFRDQPAHIAASVLVYSAGPDGDYTTWTDNKATWLISR